MEARRSHHYRIKALTQLKERFDEDTEGETNERGDLQPQGFQIFRVQRSAKTNRKRVQWALVVIHLWRRNLNHGTRIPYPDEESFVRTRGGSAFRDTPETTARAIAARGASRLRAMRAKRGVGTSEAGGKGSGSEVGGDAAPSGNDSVRPRSVRSR